MKFSRNSPVVTDDTVNRKTKPPDERASGSQVDLRSHPINLFARDFERVSEVSISSPTDNLDLQPWCFGPQLRVPGNVFRLKQVLDRCALLEIEIAHIGTMNQKTVYKKRVPRTVQSIVVEPNDEAAKISHRLSCLAIGVDTYAME
jgi:hypothetical protein